MEHSNGSMEGYTSEFEPVKKVKIIVESEEETDFKASDRSNDVWLKPKNEKKPPEESKSFCGRLTVTTHSGQHMSDGTASSSEMSPGASSPSRSCTQCGATKTPLWRNGPCGPKSLCNACGIRYKKVGSTKRGSNTNSDAHDSTCHQSGKSSAKSPKRKADNDGAHHRKSKIQARDHNNNNNNNHSNNNNNSSCSNKREPVDEKVSNNQTVFRQCPRVAVPRRVCTRRSLPAYNTPKWGSRSTRFNSTSFRKAQTKDEEEGAALLMALACGLVNA